jgi:hypothetical protein
MIEVPHYLCELCGTIYTKPEHAQSCESRHITFERMDIVRSNHRKCLPERDTEQWPDVIIVGKKNCKDELVRYKFDGEADRQLDLEIWSEEYWES